MENQYDLTTGSVLGKLIKLALPAIGSQVVQMAYNLADMYWLGHLNSKAVAVSGTVGIFTWLALTLQVFGMKGTEIGVSQNLGRGDKDVARGYLQTAISLSLILGVGSALFFIFLRVPLIDFFHLTDAVVANEARHYLLIIAVSIPFNYVNATVVAAFNSSGNSTVPFYINVFCLILNVILDPVLIMGAGMGVLGAAVATTAMQILACVLIIGAFHIYKHEAFIGMKIWKLPKKIYLK